LKVIIDKNLLVHGLSQVQRAISTKNTLPILSGVLLEAKDDQIFLTASDMELTLCSSVNAQIEEPGKIILPARNLLELARRFPPGNISLTLDQSSLSVKINYGYSELLLNSLPADEFPTFPLQQEKQLFFNQWP